MILPESLADARATLAFQFLLALLALLSIVWTWFLSRPPGNPNP